MAQTSTSNPSWAPDFLFQAEPIVQVQQFLGPGYALPSRMVDLMASTWGVLFAVGLALWVWGRGDAYALAAIAAAESLVNLALNQFLSVPRPSAPEIIKYEQIGLGSFPSGHAFTATVLWGLLWARGRVPLWLSAMVVLAVSLGRLYLGVHFLADVVAGVALGALLVRAFQAAWPRVHHWLARRSYRSFVVFAALGIAAAGTGLLLIGGRNHFMYNAAGMAAGGVVALLIEHRFVRFDPARPEWPRTLGKIVVGLLGIAPLLAVDRLTGERALWLGAALACVGSLWTLLAAPAVFRWWGWGARQPRAGAVSSRTR